MGAITVGGKGSRSRVRNRVQFRKNFDNIDRSTWKSSAVAVVKKPGKTVYKYGQPTVR